MKPYLRESVPVGRTSAGTVVFLHGFPFDGSMWEAQLEGLPDGWRGVAPDLRGFGRTGMDALAGEVSTGRRLGGRIAGDSESVLTMARLADDAADLIRSEAVAGDSAVVCGLSMGGYVALALWRRHPETVRALVLADTRAGADSDEGRENRMRMAQTVRRSGATPLARAMVPSLLSPGTADRRPDVVEHVRSMILATQPTTLVAALAGMAARADHTGLLRGITVPTLVAVGQDDQITPPDEARAMASVLPNAELVTIDDAGHLTPLENPDAFNRALGRFLQGLPQSTPA